MLLLITLALVLHRRYRLEPRPFRPALARLLTVMLISYISIFTQTGCLGLLGGTAMLSDSQGQFVTGVDVSTGQSHERA